MEVETHLWIYWAAIAAEQETAGRLARVEAASIAIGGRTLELVDLELQHGLVAISAAAHAIDGFFGAVAPMIPIDAETRASWARNRVRRPMRVLEAIKRGFAVGQNAAGWSKELSWLYDLRDAAVHARVSPEQTTPHPSGLSLAATNHLYAAPAAARALRLLTDCLRQCLSRPKASNKGLVTWCDDQKRAALESALRAGAAGA